MSRFYDEIIAEEERPLLPFPSRTLEAWLQLDAGLASAEQIGARASAVVDWFGAAATALFPSAVQFTHAHTATLTLAEGRDSVASWGSMKLSDPVVVAALEAAEKEERMSRASGTNYRCDACLDVGKLQTFDWAGALFIHLLTCSHFTRAIHADS